MDRAGRASGPVTTQERSDNAGVRVPPPLVYVAGFAAGALLQRLAGLPALTDRLAVPAAVVGVAGMALVVWSLVLFRAAGTHIEPTKPTTALVSSGPFRLTRNPVYLGFALLYLAAAAWFGASGALLMLPLVIAVVDRTVIAREERYLERVFGDAYRRYRRSVRRWL